MQLVNFSIEAVRSIFLGYLGQIDKESSIQNNLSNLQLIIRLLIPLIVIFTINTLLILMPIHQTLDLSTTGPSQCTATAVAAEHSAKQKW